MEQVDILEKWSHTLEKDLYINEILQDFGLKEYDELFSLFKLLIENPENIKKLSQEDLEILLYIDIKSLLKIANNHKTKHPEILGDINVSEMIRNIFSSLVTQLLVFKSKEIKDIYIGDEDVGYTKQIGNIGEKFIIGKKGKKLHLYKKENHEKLSRVLFQGCDYIHPSEISFFGEKYIGVGTKKNFYLIHSETGEILFEETFPNGFDKVDGNLDFCGEKYVMFTYEGKKFLFTQDKELFLKDFPNGIDNISDMPFGGIKEITSKGKSFLIDSSGTHIISSFPKGLELICTYKLTIGNTDLVVGYNKNGRKKEGTNISELKIFLFYPDGTLFHPNFPDGFDQFDFGDTIVKNNQYIKPSIQIGEKNFYKIIYNGKTLYIDENGNPKDA